MKLSVVKNEYCNALYLDLKLSPDRTRRMISVAFVGTDYMSRAVCTDRTTSVNRNEMLRVIAWSDSSKGNAVILPGKIESSAI